MWLIRLWAVLSLVAAVPAGAAVLAPVEMGQLAREATVVVHGRVVAVQGVWTAGRRGIETVVTLEVTTVLKGQPGREVSLRVPGGELGRYRSVVVGAPVFLEGQEVIVFLAARAPSLPHLLGFSQGVYRVRRDPRSGAAMVLPPAVAAAAGSTQPVRVQRGDPARRTVTIEEFSLQVRSALEPRGERERPVRQPGSARGLR